MVEIVDTQRYVSYFVIGDTAWDAVPLLKRGVVTNDRKKNRSKSNSKGKKQEQNSQ